MEASPVRADQPTRIESVLHVVARRHADADNAEYHHVAIGLCRYEVDDCVAGGGARYLRIIKPHLVQILIDRCRRLRRRGPDQQLTGQDADPAPTMHTFHQIRGSHTDTHEFQRASENRSLAQTARNCRFRFYPPRAAARPLTSVASLSTAAAARTISRSASCHWPCSIASR